MKIINLTKFLINAVFINLAIEKLTYFVTYGGTFNYTTYSLLHKHFVLTFIKTFFFSFLFLFVVVVVIVNIFEINKNQSPTLLLVKWKWG